MAREDFILGIIAGEGCFSVGIEYADSYKYGVSTRWLFQVQMNDKSCVEFVNKSLGLGGRIKARSRGGNYSEVYELYARNSNQIDAVIEWFRENRTHEFDQSDKGDVFDDWATLWEERNDLMNSESGMIELVTRAHSINSRKDTGKPLEEIIKTIEKSG